MKKKKNQRPEIQTRKPFAKKSFGQNFLVDQNYVNKIISALNPQKYDAIIEIGPGRGALTEKLVEKAGKVIAIELDKDLIPLLMEKFKENENFQLIESDALKIDYCQLAKSEDHASRAKLVANLPYYISTAILQKLIREREAFREMVLMFQREVVERITAGAGNKERGFLSVLAGAYFDAQKLFDIPPTAFRPAPKIWSSVVRIIPKKKVDIVDETLFRELLSAGFQQKRKTIFNNLKNASGRLQEKFNKRGGLEIILKKTEIDAARRAETLSLEEWKNLINQLA